MTPSALVVAADADRRAAIMSALAPSLTVTQAEGGLDGLKRLEDTAVDCVVASVDLPDVPVVGFIHRVLDEHPSLPVILVGQVDDPSLTARALRAGVFEHVPTTDRLLDHAERAIADRRTQAALDHHRRLGRVILQVVRDVTARTDREEVERAVYARLAAADLYEVVYVGDYTPADGELTVHLPIGGMSPVLTSNIPDSVGDDHVLARAVETGDVAVADGLAATRSAASSTSTGPAASMLRTAAVPFVHAGSIKGIALVSTARETAFDASERAMLTELGAVVGFALSRADGDEPVQLPTFVENLVHELRNPLGIALSHLELGREREDPASLERAEQALWQINDIIDDISKLPPLDTVDTTTTRDFGETATAAWEALDGPDAELVVEGAEPVVADHGLLERLLSNLFRNAAEHGGDDVTVRVGMTPDGFFVEDDGVGIAEVERERVFERGYSGGEGSGVGLSLVADIVEAHGWMIALVEGDAGGARFEISGVDIGDDAETTDG